MNTAEIEKYAQILPPVGRTEDGLGTAMAQNTAASDDPREILLAVRSVLEECERLLRLVAGMPEGDVRGGCGAPESLKARVRLLEREAVMEALKHAGGKVSAAAKELKLTPRMVRYKMRDFKISYNSVR